MINLIHPILQFLPRLIALIIPLDSIPDTQISQCFDLVLLLLSCHFHHKLIFVSKLFYEPSKDMLIMEILRPRRVLSSRSLSRFSSLLHNLTSNLFLNLGFFRAFFIFFFSNLVSSKDKEVALEWRSGIVAALSSDHDQMRSRLPYSGKSVNFHILFDCASL